MQQYITDFKSQIKIGVDAVEWKDIAAVIRALHACYEYGGKIYLIGNGGSAAIASHIANDLNKSILGHKGDRNIKRFQAVALVDNVPLLTAWANDTGYSWAFAEQLNNFGQPQDVLFAISSSGESESILNAVKVAKELGMTVVALCGFTGGRLRDNADESIHVPSLRYDVVESVHATMGHLITTYFYDSLS